MKIPFTFSAGLAAIVISFSGIGCKDDAEARARALLETKAKEEAQEKLLAEVTKLRAEAEARDRKEADEKIHAEANEKIKAEFAAQREKIDKVLAESQQKERNAAALEEEAKRRLAEAEANQNSEESKRTADQARVAAEEARRIARASEEENLRLRREMQLLEQKLSIKDRDRERERERERERDRDRDRDDIAPAPLPPDPVVPAGGKLVKRSAAGGSWVRSASSGARMFIFGNSIQQDTVFQIKDGPKIPVSGGPVPFCSVECLPSPFTFIPPQQARLEIPLPSKMPGGMQIPVFRFDSRLNQYVSWVPAKRAVVRSTGPLAGWIAEADVDHFSIIALCFDKERPRRVALGTGAGGGGVGDEAPPAEISKFQDEAPPKQAE